MKPTWLENQSKIDPKGFQVSFPFSFVFVFAFGMILDAEFCFWTDHLPFDIGFIMYLEYIFQLINFFLSS